ncbi:hypoxia induced protein conserved region-domain-containing protein [Xylariomycetidae sp. FL0641]|nr:hypoxia induced protein conserved region-domain-containing protein [Xylariomycetidae sp. FL0641]
MSDRPMPSSFDEDKEYQETGWQKVGRKLREEPLIPLGTALTCAALYNAWRAMRRGDHAQVQRMFRARIGAQAFTVVAIVAGGAYYGADREKRAELIKLEAQQRAEERHRRWLRELEVRDEEDRRLREAIRRKRDRKATRQLLAEKEAGTDKEKELDKEQEQEQEQGQKQGESPQLKAETSPDADGQVPAQGSKEGASILGALSSAGGGWFGSSKGGEGAKTEEQRAVEEKKVEEPTKK